MKKFIIAITLYSLMVLVVPVQAADFQSNEDYFAKLCSTDRGYTDHQADCIAFEKYLNEQTKAQSNEASKIQKELNEVKADISKTQDKINSINDTLKKLDKNITYMEKSIKRTEDDIEEMNDTIKERLTVMQEVSNGNVLIDFVMQAKDFTDLIRRVEGVNSITKADRELITKLNQEVEQLAKRKKELTTQKTLQADLKKQSEQLLSNYRQQESVLMEKQIETQKRTVSINNNIKGLGSVIPPNPPQAPSYPSDSGSDVSGTGGIGSGGSGDVSSSRLFQKPFAHAIRTAGTWAYPGGGWHPGVDYSTAYGTPIHAPANGVVLATSGGCDPSGGYLGNTCGGGYGNYMVLAVVVDNTVYTMIYAHMSKLPSVSQFSQGQVIGALGNSGNSSGKHTHIEVFKHNTSNLDKVIDDFYRHQDIYFGLSYTNNGSCSNVCRIRPESVF